MFIVPLTEDNKQDCYELYKSVFSGAPWFEDRACSTAGCKAQFSGNPRIREDKRKNTFFLPYYGTYCPSCENPLRLVDYYPEKVDQEKIIDEAIQLSGFVGYLVNVCGSLVGFSWGYKIPKTRTESVDFEKVRPLLEERGINPERAFYCAETGVIDEFQGRGLGRLVSTRRFEKVDKDDFSFICNRTINPAMLKIMDTTFGSGRKLFNDPKNGTPWFCWENNGGMKNE
ncbi:MAG: hypothetical protein NUV97_00860 [archaeon]|nr:hypothetical protein [archaeon]MCR4323489.1 hypothetical protein [Nanoarchaeota archaeon]